MKDLAHCNETFPAKFPGDSNYILQNRTGNFQSKRNPDSWRSQHQADILSSQQPRTVSNISIPGDILLKHPCQLVPRMDNKFVDADIMGHNHIGKYIILLVVYDYPLVRHTGVKYLVQLSQDCQEFS